MTQLLILLAHWGTLPKPQTINVTSHEEPWSPITSLAQTGDNNLLAIVALCIMGGIGFTLSIYAYRRRLKDRADDLQAKIK